MAKILLEMKNITKTFPGVKALDNVNLQVEEGEIHALVGENGAGKSTLMNVLSGIYPYGSYEGNIIYDGEICKFNTIKDSEHKGIVIIHQELALIPYMTIGENMYLGNERGKSFSINWNETYGEADKYLKIVGLEESSRTLIKDIGVGKQQLVEIAKALSCDARILIMDEPTASLTRNECLQLYRIAKDLRDKGVSIIFITHRFEDMYELATRVTVFRDSTYVGSWDVDKITNADLVKAMVGRELNSMYPEKTAKIGDVVLEVDNISKEGYFKNISFNVRKGEILALTGLVGAGRTEVCQTIYGIMHPDSGEIRLEGKKVDIKSPIDALNLGIGLLPENRQTQGLVNELPIYQNVSSASMKQFVKSGQMDVDKEMENAIALCKKIQLKANDITAPPSSLSGGNQQKVVVAKMLSSDQKVLIMDEPTKGIDVGAKYSIYEIMNSLACKGYGIIMVSSEMPEVLGVADRVVVMKSGRVTGEFGDMETVTQEMLLEASLKEREGHK